MIATILPRARYSAADAEQNWDHGTLTKAAKHKKLLNCTPTHLLPGRLHPLGPFLRRTQNSLFGQIKLCVDKNMFFFILVGGGVGRGQVGQAAYMLPHLWDLLPPFL